MIDYWLKHLADCGCQRVTINCHYLKQQLQDYVNNSDCYGLTIHWQIEPQLLNTGGSVALACKNSNSQHLLLINADILTDFDVVNLIQCPKQNSTLVLVDAIQHNSSSDFTVKDNVIDPYLNNSPTYTYAGIAKIHCRDVLNYQPKIANFPLIHWLQHQLTTTEALHYQIHNGYWFDIGTHHNLKLARQFMDNSNR